MVEWRKELLDKMDKKIADYKKLEKIIATARRVFFEIEGGQVGDEYLQKATYQRIESGIRTVHSHARIGSNQCTPFKYRASVIIAIPRNLWSVAEDFGGTEYDNQENAPRGKLLMIFQLPDIVLKKGYKINRTF